MAVRTEYGKTIGHTVDANHTARGGLEATGNVSEELSLQAAVIKQRVKPTFEVAGLVANMVLFTPGVDFTKDHPNTGDVLGGHRHDWEHVVILVNNPAVAGPGLLGTAASGHGDLKKTTRPPTDGTRSKVEYYTEFPRNHELQFTNTPGRDLLMMWWDFFPQP
ncbi:hypothetical protein EAF04_003854 [Stromatinia cepivora]|nr:hypothetical protein EAF04_003854 [Stromatinia cepivora]